MRKWIAAFTLLFSLTGTAQVTPDSAKLEWFRDAKLGIFIHWGIYSVNGVDESWSFHNKLIGYPEYMAQLKGFTASKYNPEAWAALIKESGAQYSVITTKHHDGVALYDSKLSTLDVVNSTPAKKDLLTPFFQAIRKQGIKAGAYFSLIDWSRNDYPGFLKDSSRYKVIDEPTRWQQFQQFCHGQINEVMTNFNPDLIWFDGDWEHSAEEWNAAKIRQDILNKNPKAIINARLQGYGDYATPEQHIPVSRPSGDVWELCMTSNKNWGYHPDDTAYKTPYELIAIFADVISNGGNLLFDIGPREDGWIPDEQVHLLKELGKWNKKHAAAIFGTRAGLPYGHYYGPSTLSKDSTTLYLFMPYNATGKAVIKGLNNEIASIKVIGTNAALPHKVVGKISWSHVPGIVYVDDIPATAKDVYMTVLEVKLKGKLSLYRGKGGFQ
ncbi:MAG: alpha-L-fucosidase [Bacteroidetes bacterium]|uniref:alpha-L-fucosidase n=1 Tax=Phnomibacter sp. TaxID=2836217 RepID=UPI002FDD7A54|nr:alpha-L-fucosidase [Bacteroidota bacterium]